MSTSLPQNLNIQPNPKPYDYNYIISMSYKLNGTEKFLNLPSNKSYGNIKYAKITAYKYYDVVSTVQYSATHLHLGNSENPFYFSSSYTSANSMNNVEFYINYGVFNGNTIPISFNSFNANYRLELFINYYY
jgi:hypothetical protein